MVIESGTALEHVTKKIHDKLAFDLTQFFDQRFHQHPGYLKEIPGGLRHGPKICTAIGVHVLTSNLAMPQCKSGVQIDMQGFTGAQRTSIGSINRREGRPVREGFL